MRQGQRGRKSRFWLWTSFLTLTVGGFLAVPVQAATASRSTSGTGRIEICKSDRNGMSGKSFSFTLNGGTPFTVVGGGCSAAITTTAGKNTVVEAPNSGTVVKAIKAKGAVSVDLSTGTIVVKVTAGAKVSAETVVTYTNASVPALGLKVCKQVSNSSPSLIGDKFSFTENAGAAYDVTAGAMGSPNCGPVHSYKLGTIVNVAEAATAGTFVSGITVSDGRGSNVNTAARTVTATIGSGVTVVTYTNNVVTGVLQTGFVEVCKSAGDGYVTGSFDFSITDATGVVNKESVAVGHCTSPIQVASGNATVTETARSPYFVSDIAATPDGRLVSSNLTDKTATVKVVQGDSSTETAVNFENSTPTGFIKVCKALTDDSGALAGQVFSFTVADVNGSHTLTFAAGDVGTTECVIDPTALPLGSAVSITEQSFPGALVVGVSVSPAGQDAGSVAPTAKLTVATGITTSTFTNEASGTLEVCKAAADASAKTQTFQFSVNGAAAISVKAGTCSKPISVPAGTATVSEADAPNFHLVSVAANLGRLVTGSTVNPATVTVPLGGVANETVVTFTNAVDTGQFKICKVSSEPTLQGVTFHFTYSYTAYGITVTGNAAMTPGSCSGISVTVPLVDSTGSPVAVKVTEKATPTVAVSNIAIDNGTIVSQNLTAGTATFNVNQGITIVTYTNVRTPVNP